MKINHRVTVILERIQMSAEAELSRDAKMALVWRLIQETDKNIHKNEEKFYTWHFDTQNEQKYTLLFSCLDNDILEKFVNRANELKGQGLSVGTDIWKIVEVIPIEDYPFLSASLRLQSLNGACIRHLVRGFHSIKGEDTLLTRDIYVKYDSALAVEILKHHLVKRANKIYGTEYTKDDVGIRYLELLPGSERVTYKDRRMASQLVTFRIKAPKEIMETALYGGIGSLTGSGFGSVVIA